MIAPPGHAALGASVTAVPNYVSSAAPVTDANEFWCTAQGACWMLVTTIRTAYPCSSEAVDPGTAQGPTAVFRDTWCSASISGYFEALTSSSPICNVVALQSLQVSFTSGTPGGLHGTYAASGSFKPTGIDTRTNSVTTAVVTVKVGGPADDSPAGTGAIYAAFQVRFPGSGLSPACVASRTGLTTVSSGWISLRY